jgi:hypothetical protein
LLSCETSNPSPEPAITNGIQEVTSPRRARPIDIAHSDREQQEADANDAL